MTPIAGWNFFAWTVVTFFSLGLFFVVFADQRVSFPSPWMGYALLVWTLFTVTGFVQSGLDLYSDMRTRRDERRGRYRF